MVSCGLKEVGQGNHANADGIWTGPASGLYGEVCYLTAFTYPDGYDWRADLDNGSVSCFITVFAETIPVLRVPVGDRHEVSSDPQRHRVIGGHLYTDWSDSSGTVIKKDGKAVVRYPEPETVVKMLVHDGKIHTLNRPEAKEGFTYRVDGEKVLERSDAVLYPHLDLTEDGVRFCFSRIVTESSGTVSRHYTVLDGVVEMIDIEGDVLDMKTCRGEVCAVISGSPAGRPFLLRSSSKEYIASFPGTEFISAEFVDSDDLCVNVRYAEYGGISPATFLWFWSGKLLRPFPGHVASAVCMGAGRACMAYNHSYAMSGKICVDSYVHDMPAGYDIRGLNPMVSGESGVYVGLTSTSGGPPALWNDGELMILDVNGYVARASLSDDVSG